MDISIFRKVFNNQVLESMIFDRVHYIHFVLKVSSIKWFNFKRNSFLLCAYGYLDLFKEYYQYTKGCFLGRNISIMEYLVIAVKRNHLDVLKFILENYRGEDYDNLNMNSLWHEALTGAFMEIMEYLYSIRDQNSKWKWNEYEALPYAAESGRLDICQWFAERFPHVHGRESPLSIDISGFQNHFYKYAVKANSVDILEWGLDFYQKDYNGAGYGDIWECAITHTVNIDVLNSMFNNQAIRNWLYQKTYQHVATDCVYKSDRETIDWFLSKKIPFHTKNIFGGDIFYRDIEFIHYIYSRINLTDPTMVAATTTTTDTSTADSKEFVEWFCNGCLEGDTNALDSAVLRDNFNLLKWIHEKTNIIGSDCALDYVAENGYLEILKWFTENKRVETISDMVLNKIRNNYWEMNVYILLNRTESFSRNVIQDLLIANRMDLIEQLNLPNNRMLLERCGDQTDVDTIQYLFIRLKEATQRYIIHHYKQGIPKDIIDMYFEKEVYDIEFQQLKYLIKSNNHPISSDTFQKIIKQGNMQIISLIKETSIWNTLQSEDRFLYVYASDIKVAKYLVENGINCTILSSNSDCDPEQFYAHWKDY